MNSKFVTSCHAFKNYILREKIETWKHNQTIQYIIITCHSSFGFSTLMLASLDHTKLAKHGEGFLLTTHVWLLIKLNGK